MSPVHILWCRHGWPLRRRRERATDRCRPLVLAWVDGLWRLPCWRPVNLMLVSWSDCLARAPSSHDAQRRAAMGAEVADLRCAVAGSQRPRLKMAPGDGTTLLGSARPWTGPTDDRVATAGNGPAVDLGWLTLRRSMGWLAALVSSLEAACTAVSSRTESNDGVMARAMRMRHCVRARGVQ